jgi:hypothetical protein
MPQFFKRDAAATKEAKFFDKRSFISLPREVSPDHHGAHEILFGQDLVKRRIEIMERDNHRCAAPGCKAKTDFEVWLELDHKTSRGQGGCSCRENLQMLCCNFRGTGHHQKKHLERKSE